ncbi:hypothetical protein [Mycobacterium sp. MUNTM1]
MVAGEIVDVLRVDRMAVKTPGENRHRRFRKVDSAHAEQVLRLCQFIESTVPKVSSRMQAYRASQRLIFGCFDLVFTVLEAGA